MKVRAAQVYCCNIGCLDGHYEDGLWALLRGLPAAIPDGVLGLQREKVHRDEVVYLVNTRNPSSGLINCRSVK